MNKRVIKIVLGVVGAILVGLLIFVSIMFFTGKWDLEIVDGEVTVYINPDAEDSYAQAINKSKTTHPTDIFVYGENCQFRKEVEYVKISKLCAEQVVSNKEFRVIVINDLNGELNLTDEDMEFIQNFVCDEKHMVMYFGDSQFDKFIEAGIISESSISSREMGFVYKYHELPIMRIAGIWSYVDNEVYMNENEELLGSAIFIYLGSYYRDYDANGSK